MLDLHLRRLYKENTTDRIVRPQIFTDTNEMQYNEYSQQQSVTITSGELGGHISGQMKQGVLRVSNFSPATEKGWVPRRLHSA